MTYEDRLRGLLGLARRAGYVTMGMEATAELIRKRRAALALLDGGAAENSCKKIRQACICCHVTCMRLPAGLLGSACGREGSVCGALTDEGFARRVIALAKDSGADASHLIYNPDSIEQNAGVQASNDEG